MSEDQVDGWTETLKMASEANIAAHHAAMDAEAAMSAAMSKVDWEPGRWWTVHAPDGSLWCETSNEREARDALRPGDRLFRQWVRTETELREERP